jgi:serine/threonine protein kinase/tetratricopeptide (TPR) repeat protein
VSSTPPSDPARSEGGPAQIHLGSFRLIRPIAEGGMAVVWGGIHGAELPVAVKVLTNESARDAAVRALFRNEVRAVAKLNHPGIIAVLDYGEVSAAAAADSAGRLTEGMPYLVMEYANGGSLGKRKRSWSWVAVRHLLVALLDALAHAHSRGVLHRDLKPGNILLAGRDVQRGGLKLTDFGIASLVDKGGNESRIIAGTPQYMAPEQHSGDFGNQGPWTDLYALGCLAWRICAGQTPFAHAAGSGIAKAHLFERPPLFVPRFPVPHGLEDLLRVLLHKDPHARFPTCADVHAALDALPSLDDDTEAEDLGDQEEESLISDGESQEPVFAVGAGQPAGTEAPPTLTAPLPADWRRAEPVRVPMRLRGAGLSLFALREIPLFGREKQRELLWKGLRAVHEQGRPRAVLVRGASGVGKTQLAEWLVHRAHEIGGVDALVIRGDEVLLALAHMLGVDRADPTDRPDLITERCKNAPDGAGLAAALSRALDPAEGLEAEHLRAAVVRFLEHRSERRPVLLVIDDAHESDEALELARELTEPTDGRRAVLVVIVARDDEGLAQRPDLEDRIARVLNAGRAKGIKLGPLEEAPMRQLLEHLGLSGALVARVLSRAAGNPQFAVQLVGDWVQRGLLEAGSDGFTLKGGQEPPIPDGLHDVWSARIARLLQPLPSVAGIHLERAAAIGSDVALGEWERACDDPSRGRVSEKGQQIRRDLMERLLDARWIEDRTQGFTFVHPMLRESLERIARKAGRWKGHHQAIATMLEATGLGDAGQIGAHLLEAGRAAEAVDPLFAGHDLLDARYGPARAGGLLLPLERAMTEAGIPDTDIRWSGLWRRQSALLRARRMYAESIDHAEHARGHAERLGDDEEWARCAMQIASAHEAKGDLGQSLQIVQKAVARLLRAGKKGPILVQALTQLASTGRLMNRIDDAERWASQAIGVLERSGTPDEQSAAILEGELAVLAARRGEWQQAIELFEKAIPPLRRRGLSRSLADVLNNHGDCLKNVGRWPEAERVFQESGRILEQLALNNIVPRLNLVICQIRVGRYAEARETTYDVERTATGIYAPITILSRTICNAATGDLPAVERELGPAVERIRHAQLVDPDIVWLAEHAADALERQIDADPRARDLQVQFLYLAREQLGLLSDHAGVERLSRRLGEPTTPPPVQ